FEDLVGLGKPAIVPIEFSGYRHFVVLRGIYNDHVFVADPYMGNTSHTIRDFIEMWTQKIVFVVSSKGVTLNALALSNEDLRIVDIPMDRSDAMDVLDNQEMIRQQQDVIESLDIRVYKRL
ncbi:MAG TPA: cysteine peptidase family C39 domain-containing protein, partial [Deltaproteobacteria bacterium]|nr:cysteine peptidase family C39 domain-containing protein [Deltaproteobacteria bacterium]